MEPSEENYLSEKTSISVPVPFAQPQEPKTPEQDPKEEPIEDPEDSEDPFEPANPNFLITEGRICGTKVRILIDDGSEVNHINESFSLKNGIAHLASYKTASMAKKPLRNSRIPRDPFN